VTPLATDRAPAAHGQVTLSLLRSRPDEVRSSSVALGPSINAALAVLIDCCVFRLLSSQPPVCTVDQPSSLAFQLTSDFHRRSIFWRCLPTQLPTLIGCQILRSAFRSVSSLRLRPLFQLNLPVNLRLASPINLSVPPLHRPATCAACRSSDRLSDCSPACAFDQSSAKLSGRSFDSRLRSTFQLRLRIDLRLAPPADPLACLPTDFQLAPSVNLPAHLQT